MMWNLCSAAELTCLSYVLVFILFSSSWIISAGEAETTDSVASVTIQQIGTNEDFDEVMTLYTNLFLFFCVESDGRDSKTKCEDGDAFMGNVANVVAEYQENPARGFSFGLARATSDSQLALYYDLKEFPSMLYVRKNAEKVSHSLKFSGDMNDKDMDETYITMWMRDNARSYLQRLSDEDFEHLTQASSGATTGDWLVLFTSEHLWTNNGPLRVALDTISSEYKHQLSVAIVETSSNPELVKRMNVPKATGDGQLTMRYFRLEKMYYYDFQSLTYESLKNFVTGGFRHAKAVKVPKEPTPWDNFLESVVISIRDFGYPNIVGPVLLFLAFAAAMSILVVLACCASKRQAKDQDTKFKKG